VMEQSPEFRNVLQRIPVAVTVTVDSSWAMKVTEVDAENRFCFRNELVIDAGIASSLLTKRLVLEHLFVSCCFSPRPPIISLPPRSPQRRVTLAQPSLVLSAAVQPFKSRHHVSYVSPHLFLRHYPAMSVFTCSQKVYHGR
jgi:hypothetical protein